MGVTGVMVFGAWYLMYVIGQVEQISSGFVTAWQVVCGYWDMGVKQADRIKKYCKAWFKLVELSVLLCIPQQREGVTTENLTGLVNELDCHCLRGG